MALKFSIEDLRRKAETRGGSCLSPKYLGVMFNYRWRCANGHPIFTSNWNNIQRGKWCPNCASNVKLTNDEVKKRFAAINFAWISGEYKNQKSQLTGKCKKCGTQSKKSVSSLRGCLTCSGKKKHDLSVFVALAQRRGGQCLSKNYVNSATRLEFRCERGHTFEALPINVRSKNTWCDQCRQTAISFPQEVVRQVLEAIFELPFPLSKPSWLGGNQSLDGYCKELRLAFEFQGRQHYEFVPRFHRSRAGFRRAKQLDKRKLEACRRNRIFLLEIRESEFNLKSIAALIRKRLGRSFTARIKNLDVDVSKLRFVSFNQRKLLELRARLSARNLRIITPLDVFVQKMTVEYLCPKCQRVQRQFQGVVVRQDWVGCPRCAGAQRLEISDVERRLLSYGFTLRNKKFCYRNMHQKIPLRCKCGHSIEKTLSNVVNGYGCRKCRVETGWVTPKATRLRNRKLN